MLNIQEHKLHAEMQHWSDANKAHEVFRRRGIHELWRQPDGRVHVLTRDPDEGIYDIIVAIGQNGLFQISAFRPKGGDPPRVQAWLERKGAERICQYCDTIGRYVHQTLQA